jgi:hypothetical protein
MKTKITIFLFVMLPVLSFASLPGNSEINTGNITNESSIETNEVKDWILNPGSWTEVCLSEKNQNQEVVEAEIPLEDWMLDAESKTWSTSTEQDILVEGWMEDPSSWLETR